MDLNDKIQKILDIQKGLTKEFSDLIVEFDLKNILLENDNLKREMENHQKNLEKVKFLSEQLKDENNALRVALKEQIFDEKLNILKVSREKINTYFESIENGNNLNLHKFEKNAQEKIANLGKVIRLELSEEEKLFNEEMENLTQKIIKKIEAQKASMLNKKEKIVGEIDLEQQTLLSKEVSDEVVQKRMKQNNIEFKIGLNWVNKIGMLLILFGISSGIKYTYTEYFVNELKAVFVFFIGLIFLGSGEFFIRRAKEIFALGLTGGGIGILYLGAYHSYINLKVIDLNVAIIIAVAITVTSFILTVRLDSATIALLSLVGGFMPFLTYGINNNNLTLEFFFVSMGYLFILNLLTLILSLYKKWDMVKYISFILNVPSLCYLVFNVNDYTIALLYSILTFAMYLVTTLAYPYRNKVILKIQDTILLAINTTASCVIVYILFEMAKWQDYRGVLAIIFCLTYFGLGRFADKYLVKDTNAIIIFYFTTFAFAVLAVPLQLGLKWFAMGWLIEAVLMIIFGYKNKIKYLEIGGWIVMGLCIVGVLGVDFIRYEVSLNKESVPHFYFRYLFLMTGMIIVLYTYFVDFAKDQTQKYTTRGTFIIWYKYFVAANFWIFALYMCNLLMGRIIIPQNLFESYYYSFSYKMLYILASLMTAYILKVAPLIKDKVISAFSNIILTISTFILIVVNFSEPIFGSEYDKFKYFAMSLLLIINFLTFINLKYLIIKYINSTKLSLEAMPIALCIYLLFNITGVLVYQFDLGRINLLFSIIYIISALICVIFGFYKQYIITRRFGLGLAVFSLVKLFFYDLSNLELGGKIISYICFGLILLGISFMYQKFSKQMEQVQLGMLRDERPGN